MGCGASSNQVHVVDDNGVVGKQSRRKLPPDASDERGDSAASKISRRSGDSGFDDEEESQRQREAALLGLLYATYLLPRNFSNFLISYT